MHKQVINFISTNYYYHYCKIGRRGVLIIILLDPNLLLLFLQCGEGEKGGWKGEGEGEHERREEDVTGVLTYARAQFILAGRSMNIKTARFSIHLPRQSLTFPQIDSV